MSKPVLLSCALTIYCSGATDVMASNFLLESEINARAGYDDNIGFVDAESSDSATILMIKPKVKLTYKDDNWDTTANANIAATSYSSEVQDTVDSYLDLGTAYQTNRNTYSIVASYDKSSNKAADADDTIIGLTTEQIDTTSLSLLPSYTRSLTERLSLRIGYGYSEVDISPESATFLPYETHVATGAVLYKLSQKSELSLVIDAIDYTSENNISEYEMLSTKVGIVHNFSEMIVGEFFAGYNTNDFTTRSDTEFNFAGSKVTGVEVVETESKGGVYEALIDAKWIELGASRITDSNTLGGLDKTDKLHAKLRMQITSLIGISLEMVRSDIEEQNESVVGRSRIVTTIRPAMNFTLTRNLKLRALYSRIEYDYADDIPGQASSDKNMFHVNLKYTFPSI